MKPDNENYSPPGWIHFVKPVVFNVELILSRIAASLLGPGAALKKCCSRVTAIADHHYSRASQFVQHHLSVWSVVMTIDIDHVIVPTRDRSASAQRLAELLGVPWAGAGPFSAVYVDDGLTLDFVETEGSFAPHQYSFRVDEKAFNAIVARLNKAGISYRGTLPGPGRTHDSKPYCGWSVRWEESDGHQWEVLTINSAPQPAISA